MCIIYIFTLFHPYILELFWRAQITILSAHVNTAVYTLMCHWSLYSAQFYTSTFPGSKWSERVEAFLTHIMLQLCVSKDSGKKHFWSDLFLHERGWLVRQQLWTLGQYFYSFRMKYKRKHWQSTDFSHFTIIWSEYFSDLASCLRIRLRYVITLHKTAPCLKTFPPLCFLFVCSSMTTSEVWKKCAPNCLSWWTDSKHTHNISKQRIFLHQNFRKKTVDIYHVFEWKPNK